MIEKLRYLLFSSETTLDKRMFVLGALAAAAGLVSAIVISIAAGLDWRLPTVSILVLAICLAAVVYAYRTNKLFFGNVVIVLLVVYLVYPFGILVCGGIFSGVPIWFAICILYIAMVFEFRPFVAFSLIGAAIFAATAYYSFINPEQFQLTLSDDFRFRHIVLSVIGVSLLMGLVVRYQRRVYTQENEIARQQKEEIAALSDAQNRFFSSMSHEIRTPLNTIIGLNEMTLRDQRASEELIENSLGIQNASKMLLALINDVLDLSKIESGRMEIAPVQYETARMLSDIVNLLWKRAKDKGLRFEVSVGDSIPSMLFGDEMRLKQVIVNILTNAIKYTNEGSVSLSVDGEKTGVNEFLLRVDVDDTGIGIRKEAIPTLFDSFKRVDTERNRNVEGTGLGLAISKQLIDLMGGTITVDSIYTKGSHFHVEVTQNIVDETPMSYGSISEATKTTSSYEKSFEAPEAHVLVVDDNDMNRMVTRKLLRGTLVQTDVASSGRECLEKTRQTHYDVIFMDHEMPEMDGIETLHQVRSQHNGLCRNTPVIALTANAGSDMSQFYVNQGFQAYLAKPIHGSLLEATLLQFLPSELIERSVVQQEAQVFSVAATRHKRPIAITADSLCDIPAEMLEAHDIELMPYYINTSSGRFRDLVEIDSDNLFVYMAENDNKVSTTPGTVDDYEEFFASLLLGAETVIHLSTSSGLSEGYNIACRAADSFGNVHVVDSRHLSSGLGLVALRAAQMAEAGETPEAIVKGLEQYREKVVTTVLIPSLDTPLLAKRLPWLLRAVGRALNLEAVFYVRRGRMMLNGFHGGYVTGAAAKYAKSITRRARNAEKSALYISHAGLSLQEQEELKKIVLSNSDFEQVIVHKASATVAGNCGYKAFGMIYARK